MKSDFKEDFESDKLDPLDGKHVEFDFDEIDRRLGLLGLEESEFEKLGIALSEILRFTIGGRRLSRKRFELIGRRLVCLAWAMRPDYFDGSPALSELARQTKVSKVSLSIHAAEARREFGVHNRAQSHGWNFAKAKANEGPGGEADLVHRFDAMKLRAERAERTIARLKRKMK